jgi:uncharacterized protein DUF397
MTGSVNTPKWRKSTYSQNDGACVEAALLTEAVAARDSKLSESPTVIFSGRGWTDFLYSLK